MTTMEGTFTAIPLVNGADGAYSEAASINIEAVGQALHCNFALASTNTQ